MKSVCQNIRFVTQFFLLLHLQSQFLVAQSNTGFFYQGSLNSTGNPVNGSYDFKFVVFDGQVTGNQIGISSNQAVLVSNGNFSTIIDAGGIFNGDARWLEISLRTNGTSNYTVLSPRQQFLFMPYAQYAITASNALVTQSIAGQLSVTNLPSSVALLTGNQVFTGTITAPIFNGTLSTNSFVPDSALSHDVNLGTNGNQQNGVKAYPPINNSTYARLPWLGYNSDFDPDYGCAPTAAGISNIINTWATNGMLAAGWNMIQLDDGWQVTNRPATGPMPWNTNTFPNGIAPLVQYAHQMGFQFQIYFSEGPASCCGYASTTGHEAQDCAEAASWGVDWLKIDFCSGALSSETIQVLWQSLIYASGRPISLMMSVDNFGHNLSYGNQLNDWEFGNQTILANSPGFFNALVDMVTIGTDTANGNTGWPQQQSPGHFNDAGILWVNPDGIPCYSNAVRQAFSAFAILGSPFAIDGTPRNDDIHFLTNSEVMGILRDPLCLRGQVIYSSNGLEALYKPLQNGSVAVAMINTNNSSNSMQVNWNQIGLPFSANALVHDPNLRVDIGFYTGSFSANIPGRDISLFILTPQAGSVAASTITGNLSVTNFNGGLNANSNTVLTGDGHWVASTTLGNPNAVTNNETRAITFNGPVTFASSVSNVITNSPPIWFTNELSSFATLYQNTTPLVPVSYLAYFRCKTNDSNTGYAAGDLIAYTALSTTNAFPTPIACSVWVSSNAVSFSIPIPLPGNESTCALVPSFGGPPQSPASWNKFELVMRASFGN